MLARMGDMNPFGKRERNGDGVMAYCQTWRAAQGAGASATALRSLGASPLLNVRPTCSLNRPAYARRKWSLPYFA